MDILLDTFGLFSSVNSEEAFVHLGEVGREVAEGEGVGIGEIKGLEGEREVVQVAIERVAQAKGEEGGREMVHWVVEEETKREVLEGTREVIDWVVELIIEK